MEKTNEKKTKLESSCNSQSNRNIRSRRLARAKIDEPNGLEKSFFHPVYRMIASDCEGDGNGNDDDDEDS